MDQSVDNHKRTILVRSTTIISPKREIDSTLIKIIIESTGLDDCEIDGSMLFTDDLGIDSLDLHVIFMEIEKELKIKIPDEDAERLRTVGSLINYIKNKM